MSKKLEGRTAGPGQCYLALWKALQALSDHDPISQGKEQGSGYLGLCK